MTGKESEFGRTHVQAELTTSSQFSLHEEESPVRRPVWGRHRTGRTNRQRNVWHISVPNSPMMITTSPEEIRPRLESADNRWDNLTVASFLSTVRTVTGYELDGQGFRVWFCCSPQRAERLRGPPSSSWPSSSAEVKNAWTYTPIPQYVFKHRDICLTTVSGAPLCINQVSLITVVNASSLETRYWLRVVGTHQAVKWQIKAEVAGARGICLQAWWRHLQTSRSSKCASLNNEKTAPPTLWLCLLERWWTNRAATRNTSAKTHNMEQLLSQIN
jgi:hypothetical protein